MISEFEDHDSAREGESSRPRDEGSDAAELDREWQARRSEFWNSGYREGIEAGKSETIQQGFNEGFSIASQSGYDWGLVRGAAMSVRLASGLGMIDVPGDCFGDMTLPPVEELFESLQNNDKSAEASAPTGGESTSHGQPSPVAAETAHVKRREIEDSLLESGFNIKSKKT